MLATDGEPTRNAELIVIRLSDKQEDPRPKIAPLDAKINLNYRFLCLKAQLVENILIITFMLISLSQPTKRDI